jgi:hypothetical protein
MITNMIVVDRVIRAIIAVAIGLLYYFGYVTGTLAIVLGVVAVVLLVTAAIGFCPLYRLVGISTFHTPTPQGR